VTGRPEGSLPAFAARECRPWADSPSIRPITGRHSLPPSSFPRHLISVPCGRPSLAGRRRGYFVHLLDRSGVRSCLSAGGAPSAPGDIAAPGPDHIPFWSEPDSIFGSSLFTAFISTSPGLTSSGLLAPDRRDAGSRRVGSRSHGQSVDRGYVVPQASDLAVAGDARWGSRPMAEHRVMSDDLLGKRITDREDATNRTQCHKKSHCGRVISPARSLANRPCRLGQRSTTHQRD